MDLELRRALVDGLRMHEAYNSVISDMDFDPASGTGYIQYSESALTVDPKAPGFTGSRTAIGDEELVRAYLLCQLAGPYGYPTGPDAIEVERVYQPVGRPTGKGGRVDVLVRDSRSTPSEKSPAFLFIECKAPNKFDSDLKYIDGQLFRLSKIEPTRPKYLVYYSVDLRAEGLHERIILIDTDTFSEFQTWDDAGQPITDAIPAEFGEAQKRRYANVDKADSRFEPLDEETSADTFSRLRSEIHDVIWGGGGTNNNEVFVLVTKLVLCKIYDERETAPGDVYQFQRLGNAERPELASDLVSRLNSLYSAAEDSYLALESPSSGPAFDTSRIAAEKIAYVVGRLEALSVTSNRHPGDLLGEFFEQIVAHDFTQSKGQFFTPVKIVRFMLELAAVSDQANHIFLTDKDHLGRPRLPYVIDPSCGSGSFLIEYMKRISGGVGSADIRPALPKRLREAHEIWFGGVGHSNAWAREYLFGIENNYDLGLSAKVNMVLHGDGSTNTWIKSGLAPFDAYWIDGRNNVLGAGTMPEQSRYSAPVNEQFDFIISNPPFSLDLSTDEKRNTAASFDVMGSKVSEAVFIERWYQLLREGGQFCCVLPEAVLDVGSSDLMRRFLLTHFRILAVVSLPYDAFRPFTSTKTAILHAAKRPAEDVAMLEDHFEAEGVTWRSADAALFADVFANCGLASEDIFMAEPRNIGYKRRKGLPDLDLPNDLYVEGSQGSVAESTHEGTVLGAWRNRGSESLETGFWASLSSVLSRPSMRFDPKYAWLWSRDAGLVSGNDGKAVPLSEIIAVLSPKKLPKGELSSPRTVVDLVHVAGGSGSVSAGLPELETLGSSRIEFGDCDLAFSKLEPYLGKVILKPDPEWLGSTEWIPLKVLGDVPPVIVAYLLMLPGVREGMRRLQGGKRHARLDPNEVLELRAEIPEPELWPEMVEKLVGMRAQIDMLRTEQLAVRSAMDALFNS